MATFHELLQTIMRRNGLTQLELARRAGISHISLCRILKASYAHKPARTAGRLADAVGCTTEERVELYRLAGIVSPEVLAAFCKSAESAQAMQKQAMEINGRRKTK